MTKAQGLRALPSAVASAELAPLPDVISKGLAAVFCGINPGLRAAATGHHFAGRGNRFWPVLHLAGFTPRLLRPENDWQLLAHGYGLTTAVGRPTAKASELSSLEFLESSAALLKKVERYRPACIAFLGKAAYAAISGRTQVAWDARQRPSAVRKYGCCPIPAV
jgi:TDG/mug DNA glycosylase family protein